MLPSSCAKAMIRSARWFGLGALLAALPLSMTASTVTVGFTFLLDGDPGSVVATYNNSTATPLTDSTGTYLPASELSSFTVSWDGNTFDAAEALDYSTLPEIFLPGNTLVPGLGYGFLGDWLVSGTIGTNAEILGLSANAPAYLATDVTAFAVTGSPSTTVDIGINGGIAFGSVVTVIPEPALMPVLALGLAGLCFARRRRAIL